MKITTADCKKAIESWFVTNRDEIADSDSGEILDEDNGKLVRLAKYKGKSGKIVRVFARSELPEETRVYVIEDAGKITCSVKNSEEVYYFDFDMNDSTDHEDWYIFVVPESYYKSKYKDYFEGLEDPIMGVDHLMPSGIEHAAESLYSFEGLSVDEARELMVNAGFIKKDLGLN